jgi:hypothetical protein
MALISAVIAKFLQTYTISPADIGHGLKCECTPILPNGSHGPVVYAICDDVVPSMDAFDLRALGI